jgi:RNA 2',3'-cyclic 3'-phosphodiesterase
MSDASLPETLRLFIAVPVPEEVKTEMEKAQAELRGAVPKGLVRWTRREQFHLTLKFLGNVSALNLEQLTQAVREACRGLTALELSAERIGFFPDARRPRVVWVGIRDQRQELLRLQRAIEAASRGFTAEAPEGEFTGHVTLGRFKSVRRGELKRLAEVVAGLVERRFGAWTADTVEVLRSELVPDGARHTTLASISLARST